MTDLHEKNCIPCRGGVPPFDISEIHKYLKKVDGWDVRKKENGIYFLEKNFTFKNFSESQKFVKAVGNIAESQGHHPDIIFGWGYAKVQIFTHKIKGLVESNNIQNYFDDIMSIETVGIYKPDPKVYEMPIKKYGCKPENICFMSSNTWDVSGGGVFGYNAVWVNRFNKVFDKLSYKPKFVIKNLKELLKII